MPSFANICAWVSTTSGTTDPYNVAGGLINAINPATALVDGETYGYNATYSDGESVGVEVGQGTWNAGAATFSRDTVETSSNSDAAVNWDGNTLFIEIVLTATQLNNALNIRYIDASESVTQYGSISGTIDGANQAFTNSQGGYRAGSTMLYVNGFLTTAYAETTPGSGIITLDNAPPSGAELVLIYDN